MENAASPKDNFESSLNPIALDWQFRLYIAGQTPRCLIAINNIKKICQTHLQENYNLEIIDLLEKPELAREHQIFAIPTLVRITPSPTKKIVGDLSDVEKTLTHLQISAPILQ